jgi:outer membrane protein assembly factor BamB
MTAHKSLRLWPGVVAAVVIIVMRYVVPMFVPGAMMVGLISAMVGTAAIVLWWLFFSRASWSERLGAIAVMVVAVVATRPLLDKSIAGGSMGFLFYVLAIPVLGVALVAWAVGSRRLSGGLRHASLVATILLATGAFTLVRTTGVSGEGLADLHWRWTPTAEERLLAQTREEELVPVPAQAATPAGTPSPPSINDPQPLPAPASAPAAATKPADWPGFRGSGRDSVIRGVRIETDWSRSPPVELWRRPIGPGWSSFAADGDLLYTQEQRGSDEIVACYRVSTGQPVWRHRDAVRFWESNGGAGPRGTPTLSNGRVYAFGATGILNVLDAANGAVVWSRNVASDADRQVPTWGFTSSPLVTGDLVIVAAAGKLAAYDVASGKPRWFGPDHGAGYSSPHLVTIDDVPQIVLLSASGATSVAPADGTVLWEHAWEGGAIVQPAVTIDGNVLINSIVSTGGQGIRRLALRLRSGQAVSTGSGQAVSPGSGQAPAWTVEERWTSRGLKPYYNDFVVHDGHAFGFDGTILSCIDLADGARKWKGGRYGAGQLMLLPEQDLLLVISEDGELALVRAATDQFTELARFPVIDGKTWNHPALVGDVLLVRNGEEMAAFRLVLAGR